MIIRGNIIGFSKQTATMNKLIRIELVLIAVLCLRIILMGIKKSWTFRVCLTADFTK